ncbi:membrane associated rhomboid family serine protease [Paenibacillus shirakamiensis]|uniref:Membrane associated rhomboid family serine protease n=1 Tax=Paenibacillus shirakamiensis TaxID=1265935 RepID=A0ABS4JHV1_9BACL|nr:rhomboid family intramembrane serine protease [Paenibacillus shirakamiensis]MBP2001283.1 membrane associated rhomboid family serine protease [Paenibacillus shirakamiensis]
MIFIRYENWRSYVRSYPVTSLILVLNLVMYLLVLLDGGDLLKYGAVTNGDEYANQSWRHVASIFLHSGFEHLLFNCFAILVFTPPLERLLGWWRYAILYLASGVIGNILSVAMSNHNMDLLLTVGASGSIYGVYGAFLYIAFFQRSLMDESSRKTLYAILIVGIVFSITMSSVNWVAHFGGLIGGFFIYGLLVRLTPSRRKEYK